MLGWNDFGLGWIDFRLRRDELLWGRREGETGGIEERVDGIDFVSQRKKWGIERDASVPGKNAVIPERTEGISGGNGRLRAGRAGELAERELTEGPGKVPGAELEWILQEWTA